MTAAERAHAMAVQGATAHRTEQAPARRPLTPADRYVRHAATLLPDSALALTVVELADQTMSAPALGRAVWAAVAAHRTQLGRVTS